MLRVLLSICFVVIVGLGSVDGVLASKLNSTSSTNDSQNATRHYVSYSQSPSIPSDPATTSPDSSSNDNTSPSTTTPPASVEDETTNWAGYVSTGGTYTAVTGSWTVPSVTADDEPISSDASWIGIGGVTSDDLIQVGTQNIVENGQVTTGIFYEQLPDTSQTISTVNVSAGDSITASINEASSGEWTITITDNTNGESYSNVVFYNSSESSAEWIEEAPSISTGVIPLDEFGSVSFTGASVDENGTTVPASSSNTQAITMENDEEQALTSLSAVTNGGFTVTRTDASAGDSNEPRTTGWTRTEPGLSNRGDSSYSNYYGRN